MKNRKLDVIKLTSEEMKEESLRWPTYCGVTGICPDGHKIHCTALKTDENTCKKLYVEFGGSGYSVDATGTINHSIFDSGTSGDSSGEILHGVSCGSETIYCNDRPSGEMDRKVTACLYKSEWEKCTYLSPEGNTKGGYCRYGDPAAPSAYKDYLYCSDLGVPSRP